MKTLVLAAVVVAAVLIIGVFLSLNSATLKSNEAILGQTTTTIPNIKITNFTCTGNLHLTKLGAALELFSLDYTNFGTIDVDNLTITLNTSRINERAIDTPSSFRFLDEYINGHPYPLEVITINETKTFEKGYFIHNLEVEPFELTVTLKSNDKILDQATITIPIRERYRD